MNLLFLSLLLALTILPGCIPVHPTDPYKPVHSSEFSILEGSVTPRSEPAGAPEMGDGELTLEQCIEIALANNPELAAIGWDVTASAVRIRQARAARQPNVSVDGAAQQYVNDQRLIQARYNGEPGDFDDQIVREDLVFKLPLFTGGRITNEIRAAELLSQSEEGRLSRTRDELTFNVSSTFFAILGQRKVIHSLEFSIQAMEEHLKQVSDLLAAQKAARVDLLRTEVRLADLKQYLVREQNVLAIQKRVLSNFMGIDYRSERLEFKGDLRFEDIDFVMDQLLAQAMKERPDYAAAKAKLEAQARRVDVAKAGHWPTVSLVASYGLRSDFSGNTEDVGSAGLGVTIPVFEGGRVTAKVDEEEALLGAAQERLRKIELQIRQEVETALLDVRSGRERVRAIEKAVEQAQESLRIERMKYELGMGSITDVLDAQSALLQSETNYYRALVDFHTSIARLILATGGNLS